MTSNYEAAGIDIDEPGVHVSRLEEAIDVVKGLFGPTPFSFDGDHYSIRELDGLPKPVQLPVPPSSSAAAARVCCRLAGRRGRGRRRERGPACRRTRPHTVVDLARTREGEDRLGIRGSVAAGKSPDDISCR